MKNAEQQTRELSTFECIVWNPWNIRLFLGAALFLVISFFLPRGSMRLILTAGVGYWMALIALLRMIWQALRRKRYDFSKSRNLARKFNRISAVHIAIVMVVIFLAFNFIPI